MQLYIERPRRKRKKKHTHFTAFFTEQTEREGDTEGDRLYRQEKEREGNLL